MLDRISLYPGRVTLTPVSGQTNTYDMVRADSPTQEGTPLNKASLLKDTTAALYGLTSAAVPDDILNVLSRFNSALGNEYLWAKTIQTVSLDRLAANSSTSLLYKETGASAQYSDEVEIVNNEIVMVSPITVTFAELKQVASSLPGKYYMPLSDTGTSLFGANTLIYISPSSVINVDTNTIKATKLYYPGIESEVVGYVNSPSSTAYPPAVDDGSVYVPLGKIGGATRIATGSYTGNGEQTRTIPLTITPNVLIVTRDGVLNRGNSTYGGVATAGNASEAVEIISGGFIAKGVGTSTGAAGNVSNKTYVYCAIY